MVNLIDSYLIILFDLKTNLDDNQTLMIKVMIPHLKRKANHP